MARGLAIVPNAVEALRIAENGIIDAWRIFMRIRKNKLHIENVEDMRRKAAAPQPKKKVVFQPKPVKDDFLAKLRLHRKRYGW